MAGIEKVCELSGEYEGWKMYSQKRDSIQVLNKYKKNFRGAKHELIIAVDSQILLSLKHGYYSTYKKDEYLHKKYEFKDEQDYLKYMKEKGQVLKTQYIYCLKVFDPALQGDVEGCYFQYSDDLKTVKRKLKRMLRCKKLNIVSFDNDPHSETENGYEIIDAYLEKNI